MPSLSDPLIVGGGPAGAAAAIRLARSGRAPLLLERGTGHSDKVCGDFLGGDARCLLLDLGIDPARLGAAAIRQVRLVHKQRVAEAALPFAAFGLSRRVLDAALLQCARQAGAAVHTGTAVKRLVRTASGWQADTTSGRLDASTAFLATGKHDLRDYPRPGARAGAVGFKTYLRLSPPQAEALAGSTELYLFHGGYAGLQPVEDGKAVLCAAMRHGHVRAWPALIAGLTAASPLLRKRLTGAETLLPRPLAIAGVPYGLLLRNADDPALFRLGDQAAVIPSLAGDGIAIALHSGKLAAQSWLDGLDADSHQRLLAAGLSGQMRLATTLHALAMSGTLQATAVRVADLVPPILRWFASATRIAGPIVRQGRPAKRGLHPA